MALTVRLQGEHMTSDMRDRTLAVLTTDGPAHSRIDQEDLDNQVGVGSGTCHAHNGELLQGQFPDAQNRARWALITLPCPVLSSTAAFRLDPQGQLVASAASPKAARSAQLTLRHLQDGPRLLRGLGNSLLPPNLDHTIFDEVHWLSAELAFAGTRDLLRTTAVYAGPTSGAAYLVARHIARREKGTIVALLPDSGHRYADTVYNENWLADHCPGSDRRVPFAEPTWMDRPPSTGAGWQAMKWQRRPLASVLGATDTSRAAA
jgi:hypothetical protein